VSDAALLLLPLGGLVYLVLVGAGATVALAPRVSPDAQAALTPVVGAALVAAASVLVPLGASAKAVAVGVAVVGAAATLVLRRAGATVLRAAAAPLVVAVLAIGLAAVPNLVRGDWRAASLYGSTDAYHWSSQARAYLDGPPEAPAAEHPDRVTYERSRTQHWAVALPFALLQLAWVTGSDPPDVYGALAALVFCLLPLVSYAAARTCIGWSPRRSAVAALAVAANAGLLFASHFSWQQQLVGSALVLGAALALRLALEPGSSRREPLLAALLAAGALATYRMGFAPYVAALLAAVVAAYALGHRRELRAAATSVAAFLAVAVVLAAPSLVALARGLPDFVSGGGFSTTFKQTFPSGQLAEALGLVPSVWASQDGWPAAARLGWLVVASAAGACALLAALLAGRRLRLPRGDFLAAGAALAVGGYLVLLAPRFSSYLSFKLLSYTAPFLVLLALAALAAAREPVRRLAAIGGAALVLASAAVATGAAIANSGTPHELATLPAAASRLPAGSVIAVALDDPWEQAWALYYLRDWRLSIERPSYLLTGQGRPTDPSVYRHRPVEYVLASNPSGRVLWRSGELALAQL
jgi:hypothetical protein